MPRESRQHVEVELPIYDYDTNAIIPRLKPFRSSTLCTYEGNGILVLGENVDSRLTELWLYKFARKSWKKLGQPHCGLFNALSTPKPSMAYFDSNTLLLYGHNIQSSSEKFQLFTYNLKTETSKWISLIGHGPVEYTDKTYEQCRKYGNWLFVVAFEKIRVIVNKKLKFFEVDLVNWEWKNSYDVLDLFANEQFEFIVHDYRIYAFVLEKVKNIWQIRQTVYCFDLAERVWSLLETNEKWIDRPHGKIEICHFVQTCDRLYIVGGFYFGRCSKQIWRFDFNTLRWSLMPWLLPRVQQGFTSDFTQEEQMYVAYDDAICQINLSKRPRSLLNLCWDKAISQTEFSSLKEALFSNILVPRKLLDAL